MTNRITRREFTLGAAGAAGCAALPLGGVLGQTAPLRRHGDSLIGRLKYPADFAHFDYVNPMAPRGGTVRTYGGMTFNSFNPFIRKGTPARIASYVYEFLASSSLDEDVSTYGLLAEWLEYPEDYAWASWRIRDGARWHDGQPVTAADVVFSLETLTDARIPFYSHYFANVTGAEDLGDGVVRFRFDRPGNRELPHILGDMPVLPKHWWAGRDFFESSLEPPLGSGPYRISDFESGRFIEMTRVEGYWGDSLPLRVGTQNFAQVRLEYFRDLSAAFEAFKAGSMDFWQENQAKRWATAYDFAAVRSGDVVKREVVRVGTQSVQTFAFNLRRPRFADLRVRSALDLAYDFEWTNKTVFYDQYARPASYFQGSTQLMPVGAPQGRELELLEELRGQVPDDVFGEPYRPNTTDGSGRIRRELGEAARLLEEAGWSVQDGELRNADGERFAVEFLTNQGAQQAVVEPYFRNLERLGIATSFRLVDSTQFTQRMSEFDFDVVIDGFRNSESPGNEQRDYWGTASADQPGSSNLAGVKDPAVDALIEKLVVAEDYEELAAATRALDRVLTHNRYMVMELYAPLQRIAYWKRLRPPEPLPSRAHGFPVIWWSGEASGG